MPSNNPYHTFDIWTFTKAPFAKGMVSTPLTGSTASGAYDPPIKDD